MSKFHETMSESDKSKLEEASHMLIDMVKAMNPDALCLIAVAQPVERGEHYGLDMTCHGNGRARALQEALELGLVKQTGGKLVESEEGK